jgi:hypothetical protein
VIRRMQLLGPQARIRSDRLAAVGARIRDGMLSDNKVVPAVLATLALLVFAWLVAGAFIGGSPDEEVANQASLAQDEEEPDSGDAESPAPGVENRDTDSYSAFESKDPFRLPEGIESKDDEGGEGKSGDSKSGNRKAGNSKAGGTRADSGKAGDSGGGGNRSGGSRGEDIRSGGTRDNEDFIDQPSSDDPDFRGSQRGGSGDLFSSGGDLSSP